MTKIVENALLIYTDGSVHPRGRKGGFGVRFLLVDGVGNESLLEEYAAPGIHGTTISRMELEAVTSALRRAEDLECYETVPRIVVRTDSRYVSDNHVLALRTWPNRRWVGVAGKPIENVDLWKDLNRIRHRLRCPVEIEWVKGHGRGTQKDAHNVRVDQLARESSGSAFKRRVHLASTRRKKFATKTKAGSVRIDGQTMAIYVAGARKQRPQRTWKLRYQVASADHPDYRATDWIYSQELLKDGHYFEVRVNDDPKYPQVVEVLREIPREEIEAALPAGTVHP